MTVFVGGVAQLYQGDFDFGRHAVAALLDEDLGPGVVVEDLHYGAVAVAQRLQEIEPSALVLVGAAERGRAPATLERRRIDPADVTDDDLQSAVREAVTGYVSIDLVLEVALAFGALPARTVTVEVEPVLAGPADHLSREVELVLADAVRLVREEVAALNDVRRDEGGVGPRTSGYAPDMDENASNAEREQEAEQSGERGTMRRTTEQGDELTEEHSVAMREHRKTVPYTRPRQPSQDPPSG